MGVSRVTVSRVLSEFARRGLSGDRLPLYENLDRGAPIDFVSQRGGLGGHPLFPLATQLKDR
ncbi:MAG: helix-turn-helix domain-containing protein [Intestinimonas sp.]